MQVGHMHGDYDGAFNAKANPVVEFYSFRGFPIDYKDI